MQKQDPKAGLKSADMPVLNTKPVNKGEIGYSGKSAGKPSSKGYVCPPPQGGLGPKGTKHGG
jgi:hypothetical protein